MRNQTGNFLMAAALSVALSSEAEAQGVRPRYADGEYTATGEYGGQPSHITVRVTLKDGVITAVAVTPHAYVLRSLQLQRAFADAVPKVVVGRRIDQVRVGKLAGSSGTPEGFNDALRQIRERAARK